jgi:LacI family transcriptional regulator
MKQLLGDRRVTIRDVARAADVSPATVSRVLRGVPSVDRRLHARVLEAATRLGYRPNHAARALRTRSTGLVGMVVPNIGNPFFPGIIQAIERELRQRGLRLLLCDSDDDVNQESELLLSLLSHSIDGLLISPCDSIASRSAVRMAAGRVAVVQVDRFTTDEVAYVGVDPSAAVEQVIEHLAERGARQFAYVGSSPRISTAAERQEAYKYMVRPIDERSAERIYAGDFSLDWGRAAARQMLSERALPHAVVCANDLTAIGVMSTLQASGVRVPEDVMVTGFDDTILASTSQPSLTTVRQPADELSRTAIEVLVGDADYPRTSLLPAQLVVRGSTVPK